MEGSGGGIQTTLMTAASSKEVASTIVNEETRMTVGNEPTRTPGMPEASPTTTLEAQLDEDKVDVLTTAAKAGIGAGAGVLGLAAILVAFLFIRRRRKQKNSAPLDVLPPGYEKAEQAELMGSPTPTDGGSKFTMSPMSEMGGGVFEKALAGEGQEHAAVSELGGSDPVELPASQSYDNMRQLVPEETTSAPQEGTERPLSGPIPSASELYPSTQARGL